MRIGDVAARLHTTTSAVRFYEREGVVPTPARRASGYREYSEGDVDRLRCLIGFRELDLPLEQASELARLCVDDRLDELSAELQRLVTEKRSEVARRLDELRYLDGRLARAERDLRGEPELITVKRKGGAP